MFNQILVPSKLAASDVTPVSGLPAESYTDLIARWDRAFNGGESNQFRPAQLKRLALAPKTWNGQNIIAYEFSAKEPDGLIGGLTRTTQTNTIVVIGCIHGDEPYGGAVLLEVAKSFWYGKSNALLLVRNYSRVVFVPCMNPDGYDLNKRYNNRSSLGGGEVDVDLNRNWGNNGRWPNSWANSSDPNKGPAPYSEPETQAIRDLIKSYPGDIRVLDQHNFGAGIDVHTSIVAMPSNDPEPSSILRWGALEAFGDTAKNGIDSRTTEPAPYLAAWAQGEGYWAVIQELGLANVDISNAEDMAKSTNWISNSLIGLSQLPGYTNAKYLTPKTYHINEAQSIGLGAGTSYVELTEFTLDIPIAFVGIAIATYSLEVYPGGDASNRLYFQPWFGQNVSGVFAFDDGTNLAGEERYVIGGASVRREMTLIAARMVFPTAINAPAGDNIPVKFGVRYKNENTPNGTPVLYRYAATVTLIPTIGGDSMNLYTLVASALSRRFP